MKAVLCYAAFLLLLGLLVRCPAASAQTSSFSDVKALQPDQTVADSFVIRGSFELVCNSNGPDKRAIVVYAHREDNGALMAAAECNNSGEPWPSDVIQQSNDRHTFSIAGWRRGSAGDWKQEVIRSDGQYYDEFNFHTRQWTFGLPSKADTDRSLIVVREEARDPLHPTKPQPVSWPARANKPVPWGLITVASGYYDSMETMEQSFNADSADRVAKLLERYRPVLSAQMRAAKGDTLRAAKITDFLTNAAAAAKQSGAKFLVLYYIGHAVALRSQDETLLMGDLKPQDRRWLEAPVRAHDDPERPLPSGLLNLIDVYDSLLSAGLPFVVLLDGCAEESNFAQRKDLLSLNAEAFSLGLDDPASSAVGSIFDSLDQIAHFKAIAWYGTVKNGYYSGNLPIILATGPGLVADPVHIDGSQVGPLAYRMMTLSGSKDGTQASPSLGELLTQLPVDRYGDPKFRAHAVPTSLITWSDLTGLKDAASGIRAE
jgi:hypothetical protein